MSQRVDHWMRERFPSLSRHQIEEAISEGLVTDLHAKRMKKGFKIETGTELDCSRLEAHLKALKAGNSDLNVAIIHEGHDFVVIDKPVGMPSHPLSLFDRHTVTHWLFASHPASRTAYEDLQPTVAPHRLDTATSGLLIVAKTPASLATWREAFRTKRVRKRYLAWCWGTPNCSDFEVAFSIAHSAVDRRLMAVPSLGEKHVAPVLEAQSIIRVRKGSFKAGLFLAEVECHTGVTHQVRVHLAKSGYPLVGDSSYDPHFLSREIQPAGHELRAIALEGEGFYFRAPEDEFASRYRI